MKTIKYKGKTYKVLKDLSVSPNCYKCSLRKECFDQFGYICESYYQQHIGAEIIGRIRWGKVALCVIIAAIVLIGLVMFVYSKMR